MSDKFTFSSAGIVHEIELAMDRVGGWNNALAKELCKGNTFGLVRDVLLGLAEIKPIEHLVDSDADPFIPKGWSVESHQKGGKFIFDPSKIDFYLSKKQKKGSYIKGNDLRKELEGKKVLNANILDYLLAHPRLIPDEWKKDENGYMRYIFFWGTIYRDSDGGLFVRYVYFFGGAWLWSYGWLDVDWYYSDPAAVLAS